jgi:hypothetical protein
MNHRELCGASGRESYAELVVLNHGVFCWGSACESWCVIRITQNESQTLAQHNTTCVTTTRTAYHNMIHKHWFRIKQHDSKPLAQHQWEWIICWASGSESWCVFRMQCLWIMVCYSVPLVVNHDELCRTIGSESCCVMVSQWLWIMVC